MAPQIPDHRKDSNVLQQYEARFGDPGEHFDTWLRPELNIALMQMALTRGSRVTEDDLREAWLRAGLPPDEFDLPEGAIT